MHCPCKRPAGTVHLVFQPAEEGGGGARRMIEQGFLDLFPCDAAFAMHNVPGLPEGRFAVVDGPAMAGAVTCIVRVRPARRREPE